MPSSPRHWYWRAWSRKKPSLQKTRTVKGGQAATAATAGLGVVEVVQQTIDPARDALVGLAHIWKPPNGCCWPSR
jgi:hypothetical protein